MKRRLFCSVLLLTFTVVNLSVSFGDTDPKYKYITGYRPVPSRPHRRAGGESFPPLPLPVVPMRRTEKKKPPSPPVLLGKLRYGIANQWIGYGNNATHLIRFTNRKLGVKYRATRVDIGSSAIVPEKLPILFMTGLISFSLSDSALERLKNYLIDGGTLFLDCNSGHYEIKESFTAMIQKMFPATPLRPLPQDHPLYYTYYRIEDVTYSLAPSDPRIYNPEWRGSYPQAKRKDGPPLIYGLDIGSRTAIFLSTYDLGCGWAGKSFPFGNRYSVEDSLKIGTNMVAYVLQFYPVGKYLSMEKSYRLLSSSDSDFSLAQVIHSGYWDPAPTRLGYFLKSMREKSTFLPDLKLTYIPLSSEKIFSSPFLYLTGHDRFSLSDKERANLRVYFQKGGTLFVENRCGRSTFDESFREEMKNVLPDAKLEKLSGEHPLFHCFYSIEDVLYSPWVEGYKLKKAPPFIEGVKIGNRYPVIYSKYDLAWGWEREVYPPYTRGVIGMDSFKLAANIMVYSLTH
ncbi:MAG TPA: DUF4159 domain-containing protein [Candidatus Omnitrophica bacterium]|nr:DUF4159 domain-containing protein [Candidatus Omnitrophota bacterium]